MRWANLKNCPHIHTNCVLFCIHYEVRAGSTVVIPAGVIRGVVVHTRLAFIAVRIAG